MTPSPEHWLNIAEAPFNYIRPDGPSTLFCRNGSYTELPSRILVTLKFRSLFSLQLAYFE